MGNRNRIASVKFWIEKTWFLSPSDNDRIMGGKNPEIIEKQEQVEGKTIFVIYNLN